MMRGTVTAALQPSDSSNKMASFYHAWMSAEEYRDKDRYKRGGCGGTRGHIYKDRIHHGPVRMVRRLGSWTIGRQRMNVRECSAGSLTVFSTRAE